MRRAVPVAAFVAVVFAVAGCGSSGDSQSAETPAERLAALDGGDVSTFQQNLDSLKRKCLDSEEKIASFVYGTQKTMEKNGVNESLASVIEHVDQSIPANAPKQRCIGVFAAYATLRAPR